MIPKYLFIFVSILLLASCAHAPVKEVKNKISISVKGSIVDRAALLAGGTLGITPLKAGPMAEANDELDRLSSMVTKGLIDTLDGEKTSIAVINDLSSQPKLVFEGYVEELSKPGRFSRVMLKPNVYHLVLVGDLWMVSTGKRILEFSIEKSFDPKKEKIADIGYVVGEEIGKFIILNASSKEKS